MGCSGSKTKAFNRLASRPEFQVWTRKFEALCIHKAEVKRLYNKFAEADMDGGGTIDLLELLTVIDVERTPFTERIFQIFDDDNSGKIDFGEFVLSLWNYCTLSKVTLGMFAFDLYDRDSTGILEDYDLEKMMLDIYGKNAATSHYAKQVLKDLVELHMGGPVDLPRFLEFTRTHHSLLFPAFQLQLALKKTLLGVSFWERHAERRVKISKDKFIKIKDLLALHAANKVEQLRAQVNAPGGQVVLDNTGTKTDRRRKNSQLPGQMQGEAQKAIGSLGALAAAGVSLDQAQYRDKYFNDPAISSSGASNKTHNSSAGSLRRAADASPLLGKAPGAGDSAASRLQMMEKELAGEPGGSAKPSSSAKSAAGGSSKEGQEGNARVRRKSLTNSAIQPISEDGNSGHGGMFSTNKDLEGMLTQTAKSKPSAEPAPLGNAVVSAGTNVNLQKPQRKRGTAASFIINNTNNGLHSNNIEQVERIVSHVQALNKIGEDEQKEHNAGYTVVEDQVFDRQTRGKPQRRGSI